VHTIWDVERSDGHEPRGGSPDARAPTNTERPRGGSPDARAPTNTERPRGGSPDARAPTDAEEFAGRLAEKSIAAGDATGWFERLYAAADAGETEVPWDRGVPSPFLTQWAAQRGLAGSGQRALVVGCGLGNDAEFTAGLGFQTVAFDISPSAIALARRRFPASTVLYMVANLLDPPAEWHWAFDLVVESLTLQALPDPPRRTAIAKLGDLVAPAGTLIVIARAREPGQTAQGPPWALTRSEIDALTDTGLEPVRIEDLNDPHYDWPRRWRAEFRRPAASA
jgi:SAM-dependent methyltransferase